MRFRNQIIATQPTFIGEKKTLNYEAICVFAAIGFFLDKDTYYNEQQALKPAHEYEIEGNAIFSERAYFKWHYSPIERPLSRVVKEFADLFEGIIKEQVGDKKVILPISGGLDSRTQATALSILGNEVHAYGYAFQGGHDETYYGKKIAKACKFPFKNWKVPPSYLWNKIEDLAKINGCYSEFTHPRQMAFVDQYANLGEIFSLGHWGDVLFDDMGVPDNLPLEEQVEVICKKIIKRGGSELAESLWKTWKLEGDFKSYLSERVKKLVIEIDIPENANAQIRAFKSLYWANRWTNSNLSVFESVRPISVPYFDDRMCEFICTVPEKYLSGRQIQIEYLKMRMPKLAKIAWQDHRPFNLYHHSWDKSPYNLPFRTFSKIKKIVTQKSIQRNWELQFLGDDNDKKLQKWLFENESFKEFIPEELVTTFYNQFKNKDSVNYSHAVSMLLTFSLFAKLKD